MIFMSFNALLNSTFFLKSSYRFQQALVFPSLNYKVLTIISLI